MRQSGSLIYLLGFIIVISASILVTSLGKDTANEGTNAEANIETPAETEGTNPDESAAEETGVDEVVLAQGEKLVNQKCIACHGGNLEGGRGPELKTVGSRLTKDDIESILRDGNKTMPPNLLKTEEDTIAAALYLSTLK